MKQLFSIALIALGLNAIWAQKVFLNNGINFTTYDYNNSQSENNPDIESSSGSSYEIGYTIISALGKKVDIAAAMTLDQYNATGGNMVNNYSWNTNYLGLQGVLKYKLIEVSNRSKFSININAGINFNHIIEGEQKINGQTFKLTDQEEFNGLFIKHIVGLQVKYHLMDYIAIGISYNFSKNYGLSGGDENLNFNNRQLQFGITIN
jgi:hypothetical protein